MNEPQWNQEAETFAQVWQRVSPDPDASPIQTVLSPAPPPALPPGDRWTGVLRELITLEVIQWRRCRILARQTSQRALTSLAEKKLRRARRLAAALFLRCQVWYLPLTDRRPANRRPATQQMPRAGYSALFQGAQTLQVRYEAAARQAQPPELALFRSAVEELTEEQRVLIGLLSRQRR